MPTNIRTCILISRFATKIGDHAWDLALPIFLVSALKGRIDLVAALFFVVRLAQVLLMSRIGEWSDRHSRMYVVVRAILVQVFAVCTTTAAVFALHTRAVTPFQDAAGMFLYILLFFSASGSALGSATMNNVLAADWVPALLQRFPIRRVALTTIAFTSACFLVAGAAVWSNNLLAVFLGGIVISRIGLYGYTLCEIQLRQDLISEEIRGEVSGKASALGDLGALCMLGCAMLLGNAEQFKYLALFSFITAAAGTALVARSLGQPTMRPPQAGTPHHPACDLAPR